MKVEYIETSVLVPYAPSVEALLNGQLPNTMITAPPYGIKYDAGWRAKAKNTKATERELNSSLKNDEQADWYDTYALFPGTVAYVWHASVFFGVVMDGLVRAATLESTGQTFSDIGINQTNG